VILLLKPLKRLTHGAEEKTTEQLELETYEIADPILNKETMELKSL
jgi:POT family proton-dependent oligopeptide transporter